MPLLRFQLIDLLLKIEVVRWSPQPWDWRWGHHFPHQEQRTRREAFAAGSLDSAAVIEFHTQRSEHDGLKLVAHKNKLLFQ